LNKIPTGLYAERVSPMDDSTLATGKKVLPIVSVITFIGFLDTHLLIPVMSLYAQELGAGIGTVGLIIGLYSIVNTPANILFGWLIDRYGYKLILLAGLLGDAASMFLYSLCRTPLHLILVRLFHGVMGGIVGPATMSAISYHGNRSSQGRNMAVYGMSLAAATLVGYGLSGILSSRVGYDIVFQIGAGLLVLGACLSFLLPGRPETVLMEDKEEDRNHPKIGNLLKRKGLISPYFSVFAQYFTFGSVVTLLPLYVKDLGMDSFHVGMLLVVFAVVFIIVQMPVSRVSDRFGRLTMSIIGLAGGTVALLLLPTTTAFAVMAVLMVVYGAAFGAIFPSISAMVAENTSEFERGMATGIFHALLTAGVAVGALTAGWAGDSLGVKAGLLTSPTMMVVALTVAIVIRRLK
jgi:MFS family permease